uniref:acetyl-CoA C-acetyltransferase n=1 Tax=Mus spicilegus TaxID=10103 RepID=A0A8C6GDY7_MUSSI
MHRLPVVLGHLAGRPESSSALQAAPCSARFPQASASDVVVVHGRRTPIGRASRGGFKDTTPDELLSAVLTAVLQDVRLKPEQLGDISVAASQRLYLCLRSTDCVHRDCRQWPT